jgi:pimeloyl-ACP methyl ester carboxylesterase
MAHHEAMPQPYVVHNPQVPNPPTLVVLPGVNSGPYLFHGAAEALGATHRLVVFNPPGTAGVPLPMPFSVAAYARGVVKALEKLNLSEMAILGHSLGGFAAQKVAMHLPSRVGKLVLVSTSPGQPHTARDVANIAKATGKQYWELMRAIESNPHGGLRPFFGKSWPVQSPDAYAAFIADRQRNLPPTTTTLAQMTAGGMFSSVRWVHKLTMPALVIHGNEDIMVSSAGGRLLAQRLPNARYLELFGTGHFPMLEHPGFYPAVARFLAGQEVGEKLAAPESWLRKVYDKWFPLHG